jgi:hypothetical protein
LADGDCKVDAMVSNFTPDGDLQGSKTSSTANSRWLSISPPTDVETIWAAAERRIGTTRNSLSFICSESTNLQDSGTLAKQVQIFEIRFRGRGGGDPRKTARPRRARPISVEEIEPQVEGLDLRESAPGTSKNRSTGPNRWGRLEEAVPNPIPDSSPTRNERLMQINQLTFMRVSPEGFRQQRGTHVSVGIDSLQ